MPLSVNPTSRASSSTVLPDRLSSATIRPRVLSKNRLSQLVAIALPPLLALSIASKSSFYNKSSLYLTYYRKGV